LKQFPEDSWENEGYCGCAPCGKRSPGDELWSTPKRERESTARRNQTLNGKKGGQRGVQIWLKRGLTADRHVPASPRRNERGLPKMVRG